MRKRLLILTGVLALSLLGPASGAEAAVEKSLWGPTSFPAGHPECPAGGPSTCSAFPLYRQLGVDVYQIQLPWSSVARSRPENPRNPDDPAYRWPSFADYVIQEAAANGIQVAFMVKSTPDWANGGQGVLVAPNNPKDYADFMFAASRRYPSIKRWMIWGEPNYGYNFLPMPQNSPVGPRLYAKVLDAAYVALKEADKNNIVIGGMTLNSMRNVPTPDFIRWLRIGTGKKARPPRVDWWGHNPFEARFPNIALNPSGKFRGLNDVDTLHKELKRAYVGKKKKKKGKRKYAAGSAKKKKKKKKRKRKTPRIWLSEWTVLSDHPTTLFLGYYVSRQEQANWVSAAYSMADKIPYVQGLGWYRLDDQPAGNDSAAWGLMTYAGERKPSFYAYDSVP